ncbi:MAG: glycosyltransferase, partial [Saprospiraceae bacterium]
MSKKQCLLIFGMHRSGTSAFAGLLKQAGIPMGQLKEGSFDNPKGFYENKKIVQFNDQILKLFGQSWDSTIALPDNWVTIDQIQSLKATIKTFIQKEFKKATLFALKDPRFSLTLPLWKEIFVELEIELKQFILVRHPYEVANSLYKRNHIIQTKGMALWMKYLLNAEFFSRGDSRSFISYQDFLTKPAEIMNQQAIDFKITTAQLTKIATDFIDSTLRHHHSQPKIKESLLGRIYQPIMQLTKNAHDEIALAILDALRTGLDYQTIIIKEELTASLTVDYGQGFTEIQRTVKPIQIDTKTLTFSLPKKKGKLPKRIQFYPGNVLVALQIRSVKLYTEGKEEIAIQKIIQTPLLEHGRKFIFNQEGFIEIDLTTLKLIPTTFSIDLTYLNFRTQAEENIQHIAWEIRDWQTENGHSLEPNLQSVKNSEKTLSNQKGATVYEKEMQQPVFWLSFLATLFKYPGRFLKQINAANFRKLRRALANESPTLILRNLKRLLLSKNSNTLIEDTSTLSSVNGPSTSIVGNKNNKEKKFGTILYIAQDLPDYDNSSGGKRATRLLELLAQELDVYVFSLGDKPQKYKAELSKRGVVVLETTNYKKIKKAFPSFTAIVYSVYRTYEESKRFVELYPDTKIIIDTVDVNWLREERSIGIWEGLTVERVAKNKTKEIAVYQAATTIWAVTEQDKEVILKETPSADVRVVSNIHEPILTTYQDNGTNTLLFIGNYTHYPNISAIKTLALTIFPKVRAVIKEAQLIIAGSQAPDEVIELGNQEGIIYKGFIAENELDELYKNTFLSVSPLLTGAGIKGKICEAIAYMTPVVTNEIGNEGINLIHEAEGLITPIEGMSTVLIKALQRKYAFEEMTSKAQTKLFKLVGSRVVKQEILQSIFPKISICIVTWNKLDLLKKCIASIEKHTHYPSYKILIHSNACTDGTVAYLKAIAEKNERIIPILGTENEVFVLPNNRMMEQFPNNDVVLLNNDVQVTANWLLSLQETAYTSKDYGIVGAKILYPDGSLQEFGAELYADGTGINIGKGDNPNLKKYNQLKEVGYVSGCAMYIKRSTINTIGTFDEQFHPCYFEDSDYCYAAKEKQLKTVVTPH